VNGILKDFLKRGYPKLTETNLLEIDEQKKETIK